MAGSGLSALLILLLSFTLGSARLDGNSTRQRIVNGVPCRKGAQPWQVALFYNNTFHCAGVLVGNQWVLTVAHCHLREYIVHIGSNLLNDPNAQKIKATQSFLHPSWDPQKYSHDIMLLKLSRPAQMSPTVKKVRLSSTCKLPGTRCTLSGWGSITTNRVKNPSDLICSQATIITYQNCRQFHSLGLTRHEVCAMARDRRSASACKGDSGAPLMCGGTLQGLVAYGYIPCEPPFEPVVYTRVCKYNEWINESMKQHS